MTKTISKLGKGGKSITKTKPNNKLSITNKIKTKLTKKVGFKNNWAINFPEALSSVENVTLELPPAWPARALIFKIYQAFESGDEL
jgi:hypothetical protein